MWLLTVSGQGSGQGFHTNGQKVGSRDIAHAPFGPSAYQVVVGPVALPLRPNLEEDAARLVEAYLVPRDAAEADPMGAVGSAIARISWRLIRYSAVEDAGLDPILFADSVSRDLLETTRILFKEDGTLREFAGAAGNDLLYFTSATVEPGHDLFSVAVELRARHRHVWLRLLRGRVLPGRVAAPGVRAGPPRSRVHADRRGAALLRESGEAAAGAAGIAF